MENDERWTVFTQDTRYRWRERIVLGLFIAGLGLFAWQWQAIDCRILSWRLGVGVNEWEALNRLADRGPTSIPYIAHHMDDPDPDVRYKTLLTLKAMQAKETKPLLLAAMRDPDVDVRVNAFDAMAEIGATEAIPILIHALRDDDVRARRVAHQSLHTLTDEKLDYEPQSTIEENKEAIARWDSWWSSQEPDRADVAPVKGG